jgi:AP-4 complex subunit mu-1
LDQHVDGIQYISIRQYGMYFVLVADRNVSPSLSTELLVRIAQLIKDYCGVLSEESIRKNFVLVYELLDEIIDFGYPQTTSTDLLKSFVFDEPIQVTGSSSGSADTGPGDPNSGKATPGGASSLSLPGLGGGSGSAANAFNKVVTLISDTANGRLSNNNKTAASFAANKSVLSGGANQRDSKADEIFVDQLERLTVLFSGTGALLRAEVEGAIKVRSFLQGHPQLRLTLNDDLWIRGNATGAEAVSQFGGVRLDDAMFHSSVGFDAWDSERCLIFTPPDGEFTLMQYRVDAAPRSSSSSSSSSSVASYASPGSSIIGDMPFQVFSYIDIPPTGNSAGSGSSTLLLDLTIRVRAQLASSISATHIQVQCPLPRGTSTASCSVDSPTHQKAEYRPSEKAVVWDIKRLSGGQELALMVKLVVEGAASPNSVKREIGPISLKFDIPMYSCSNVQIKSLRITGKDAPPLRWIRTITQSDSYVARLPIV